MTATVITNWYAGWTMVLAGIFAGVLLGFGFHRESFLGGYASLRRRLARLGHVALIALGAINVLFAVSSGASNDALSRAASACFIVAGVLMPLVCFLAAWRVAFRHAFALPVLALVLAVVLVLAKGPV